MFIELILINENLNIKIIYGELMYLQYLKQVLLFRNSYNKKTKNYVGHYAESRCDVIGGHERSRLRTCYVIVNNY